MFTIDRAKVLSAFSSARIPVNHTMSTHIPGTDLLRGEVLQNDSRLEPEGIKVPLPGQEFRVRFAALRSFFNLRNHPLQEADFAEILGRDLTNEARIARASLLRCIEAVLESVIPDDSQTPVNGITHEDFNLESWIDEDPGVHSQSRKSHLPNPVREVLVDFYTRISMEVERGAVDLYLWDDFRKRFDRDLRKAGDSIGTGDRIQPAWVGLLEEVIQRSTIPTSLAKREREDLIGVIRRLSELLGVLALVEGSLQQDRTLKQTLPLFTLINQEVRLLLQRVESLAARLAPVSQELFDALDGTKFALSMELRKVFAFELVGVSSLRQAPAIYAKVENSHGLLRDSFQQSVVGLAQFFDENVSGGSLFSAFQTKLEQSLALRNDLWFLLQLVRKAEQERDLYPIARLIDRLTVFKEGSLRYLMFKDWEACERFIEEVGAARGAIELAPVLNRFSAYLETLHGQINMRAVLANHPFDYPQSDV
jgi:hypothetical protein